MSGSAAPTVSISSAATPWQRPTSACQAIHSRRTIAGGDFVFGELSAAWWDYSGPGAARIHGRCRADAALSRSARDRRCSLSRRSPRRFDRGFRGRLIEASSRHREERLHHHATISCTATVAVICADPGSKSRPAGHPETLVLQRTCAWSCSPMSQPRTTRRVCSSETSST